MLATWVSNLGDGMALAAGPLLVASQTRDPFLVAAAAFVQRLPLVLFGLYAGALADRLNRKMLVVSADLARVGLLVLLVTFIGTGHVTIWVVLAVLFALGVFETMADTTGPTLVPMLVASEDLGVANSRLLGGYITGNQLIGPPVGAFLFAAGMVWSFVAQAVLVLAGALILVRVSLPSLPPTKETSHLRRDIGEGIGWLVRHPAMRTLALVIVTFNVTFGAAWSVLVLYAQDRLSLGHVGFGLLTTVSAVGGLVGTAGYGWLERRFSLGDIMRVGLIWETVSHALLAVTTQAWVAMVIFFVFGAHAFIWGTTSQTVRQRAIPAELQGRVGSAYMIAMFGGLLVGQVIGGVVASHWGIVAPFWFGFAGSALILVAIWRQLPQIAHDTGVATDTAAH